MNANLHYTPGIAPDFHCHIPLTTMQPLLLVNGVCRNIPSAAEQRGFSVAPYCDDHGVALAIASGVAITQPLQIIYTRNSENTAPMVYENSIIIASQAQATLLICDHTLSPDEFSTDSRTMISVDAGARLEIVWMQSEHSRSQHCSTIHIRQQADSVVECTIITLHGGSIENNIEITLLGAHADCRANGLFLIDGQQQFTTNITIRHDVGHCHSNQLFKGIVDNEATGRFHGQIIVAPHAQKTEAYQANNNLLLTGSARIYTRPQLEIYADDVRCSHGATIGQLDEQALFYLRSRGVPLKEAWLLQQTGFVQDVLDRIRIPLLHERIVELVEQRLRGEFSRCSDCELHCC